MSMRRNGPREGKQRGRTPRVNRYNPNAPDWRAVHLPHLFTVFGFGTPTKEKK